MYSTQLSSALLVPALLASLAAATPITNLQRIQDLHARNSPCEPGGTPILYKEYHEDACPPKNKMDDKAVCPKDKPDPPPSFFEPWNKPRCTTYCEVRQTFTYDQEKPLDQPYCHGPLTCTVGENKATAYTYNVNVDPKWLGAINVGVTGGYSTSETTTTVTTKAVKLENNECGYFTFLPILHESCGTVSEGKFHDVPLDHCDDYQTSQNVCTKQPYRSGDGKYVMGDTVFVRTDCSNRERLPMDKQDPAYQHDGVAQPQSAYTAFANDYDCVLSPECSTPFGNAIDPKCVCKCNGEIASMHAPGCQGFKGALPDPPRGGAGSMNGAPSDDGS